MKYINVRIDWASMNWKPFAVVLMMVICVVPMIADSSSADDDTATIDGYIKIDNVFQKNTDLTITFYYPKDSTGADYSSISVRGLNTAGYFKLQNVPYVQITRCYISFVINAYSIGNLNEYLETKPNYNIAPGIACYKFKEQSDSMFYPGKTYTVSVNDSLLAISMVRTYGDISGRVMNDYDNPIGLNGASIIISEDAEGKNVVKTGTTHNGGHFSLTDCPTGTYYLTANMNGYSSQTHKVTISQGTTTEVPYIHLTQDSQWFGMDIPHALLVIAGGIAAFLLIFGICQVIINRQRKGRGTLVRVKR